MSDIIKQLKERKSTRSFTSAQIPPDVLDEILECAFAAPTAGCQQLYTILNITDQQKKDALAISCDNQPFIAKAPLVLIFLADCRRWLDGYELAGLKAPAPREADLLLACADAIIAAQNAAVAADSFGIGSCYIGDVWEQKETVTELLGLDKYVFPAAMLVFGYPTAQQESRAKPKRFAKNFIVQENSYHRLSESEQRALFASQGSNLDTDVAPFGKRKYMSDFACEMRRSVAEYLKEFGDASISQN
ncbi:MAG: nitroreductase family protein [Clostridiales bacterium]|nr:nitroreductase family protein [Clostridiales bacterium]